MNYKTLSNDDGIIPDSHEVALTVHSARSPTAGHIAAASSPLSVSLIGGFMEAV